MPAQYKDVCNYVCMYVCMYLCTDAMCCIVFCGVGKQVVEEAPSTSAHRLCWSVVIVVIVVLVVVVGVVVVVVYADQPWNHRAAPEIQEAIFLFYSNSKTWQKLTFDTTIMSTTAISTLAFRW